MDLNTPNTAENAAVLHTHISSASIDTVRCQSPGQRSQLKRSTAKRKGFVEQEPQTCERMKQGE